MSRFRCRTDEEFKWWSPDEVEQLCEGLAEGLSFSQLGERLGRRRDQVAGKVYRLAQQMEPKDAEAIGVVANRVLEAIAEKMGGA